jgi:NADH-quinone oxidoreductase subunit L
MDYEVLLGLVVLFPLLGAIANGFLLRRASINVSAWVGTLAIAIPFVMSLLLVLGPVSEAGGEGVRLDLFPWLSIALAAGTDLVVPFSFSVDRLSGILLLIITGIGTLIHLYSRGYMDHEKGAYRFFAYLNLFIFSMLCLVLGSNMLVTFLGWEGVGVCSYLLIGYWYEEEANASAGMKAFVANRVGDLGFLVAMFMSVLLFGSLDYATLSKEVAALPPEFFTENQLQLTIIGLCLLLGVAGKSAQLPLYVWLPDAMAGPTPVSALIHAATMVTAGIYLMTRMSFLLVHSEVVMMAIACVGAATALFAATIGLVQNDIKKVLAYSTVSQLGFMVLGCGVGAFQYGVAHLMTHAFFKALLFLGAGSVIHAMHHEQDIRKMGGLIRSMPLTGWTFVIGTLAIIGFPGFSGFFSKDEILFYAWTGTFGHPVLWAVGALAAACTSFYMVRLTVLVFFGKPRMDHHTASHLHESSWLMTLPLAILAVFATIGGYVSLPHGIAHLLGFEGDNAITRWLKPVLYQAKETMTSIKMAKGGVVEHAAFLEWGLMGVSVAAMVVMSLFAMALYRKGPSGGDTLAQAAGGLYRLVLDKWRIDELYQALIYRPLAKLGDLCFSIGDRLLIEGFINEGPRGAYLVTSVISDIQAGLLRNYLKLIFLGVVVLAVLGVVVSL